MTTANPYVCSDIAASNDLSVPYCDSEDDTEFHNGLGSDALMDDIHLEANFQDHLRRHHNTIHKEHERTHEHFDKWRKDNKSTVDQMRLKHKEKNKQHQKSHHTAAGKKAHKDNKGKKSNQKMGKFTSDFRKLCESWKHLSHNHYHSAWVESRNIVHMEAGDIKTQKTIEYNNHHKSQEIRNYLGVLDPAAVFVEISKEDRYHNMIKFFQNDTEKWELSLLEKKEKSLEDHNEKENAITGGK